MCRMIGIWSDSGVPVKIPAEFAKKCITGSVCQGSSPGHQDGWGLGAFTSNGCPVIAKKAKMPTEDPEFEQILHEFRQYPSLIFHLRKASDKGSVSDEKCHPFCVNGMLFAHNGGLGNYPSFAESGMIDTEHFANEILADVDFTDPEGSIARGLGRFHMTDREFDSISFLCLLPDRLLAYREYSEYPTKASPEAKAEYYTLFTKQEDGVFLVASEPVGSADGWLPLKNRVLAVISAEGVSYRQLQFGNSRDG